MRAKRIDENQTQIVEELRKRGFSVAVTSSLGKGFPDIVVGRKNKNFLFELKDNKKTTSQKKLTPDEEKFKEGWKGQYNVVETIEEIIKLCQL
jgi:Holliday junction resolvase